ncbi:MAG: GGDEF domain-containing protein [bacterium]|nr:GGDEF domain-containing protein [bacterium]
MTKEELIKENQGFKLRIAEIEAEAQKAEARKKIIANVNKMLDRSLYELSVINKINKLLSKTLDYTEIIKDITHLLSEMVEYVASGILLWDDKTCLFKVYLRSPRNRGFISQFSEKASLRFAEFAGQSLPADKFLIEVANPELLIENETKGGIMGSFLASGLKVAEKTIGLICIAHTRTNGFSPEDTRLLELLANNSAIAIENGLLHKEIEELAITDGLTGLNNYRYFKESIHREIVRSSRYDLVFSLLLLDIDNFKMINDTYGHPKGDEVLSCLAKIIKNSFHREIDILARYGGEEFTIILPQTTRERAYTVAEKMRRDIEKGIFKQTGLPKPVTISCGIAQYPDDGRTEDKLIKSSDTALYLAKNSGKNRICLK